jgi:uncharacterized protein
MATRTYPSYYLYKDNAGQWRWTYEASNGETIAVSSESYKKRADAERGIEIMQASRDDETWFPTSLINAT